MLRYFAAYADAATLMIYVIDAAITFYAFDTAYHTAALQRAARLFAYAAFMLRFSLYAFRAVAMPLLLLLPCCCYDIAC